MFQSFLNKSISAGKIKEVFILPNGSLQFQIRGEFLHENSVNITSIEKIKQYALKAKPNPFEIWAMKTFVKAMQSPQRSGKYMQRLIKEYDEAHLKKHRGNRNLGQIDNHQRVYQNVQFKLSQMEGIKWKS